MNTLLLDSSVLLATAIDSGARLISCDPRDPISKNLARADWQAMDQLPRQDAIDCIGDLDLPRDHPWQCEPLDQRNWINEHGAEGWFSSTISTSSSTTTSNGR